MYFFRLNGRAIEVIRYIITGSDNSCRKDGVDHTEQIVEFACSYEDALVISNRIGGVISDADCDCEWMDGIIIDDDVDPASRAIEIYEMGEAAYKAQQVLVEKSKNEQLRADLDYVMLMGGL